MLQLNLLYQKPAWRPPTEPLDLTGVKRLSLDVERYDPDLNRLGPGTFRNAWIAGLAIGTDDGRRAYYPVRHAGGGNCEWDVRAWAQRALSGYRGEVVGAKLLYDLEALAHEWGVDFSGVSAFHDVQLAEAVIDENKFSYSLDSLSREYLGEGKVESRVREVAELYGWKTNDQVKGNLWQLSGLDVGEYGEGDVDQPLRILERQLKLLESDQQSHIYELERELIPVLLEMRLRGVRVVPTSQIEQVRDRMLAERERWMAEVKRLLGPRADPGSSGTLGPALRERGLPVSQTSKKNSRTGEYNWSVTKEFLEKHAADEAVSAIAACRRVSTLINLTIDSLLEHLTPDGRIHCEFNQLKGEDETGKLRGSIARFSASHINMQQIPTRQSEFDHLLFSGDFDVTKEVRGLLLPEDGEAWESSDESQVEWRLLAHYAVGRGAEEARDKYRNDPKTDFHKLCAELLSVDPEDTKRRKRIKNTNFCAVYGGGDGKLAVTFNCPLEEAVIFHREYNSQLPFVNETYDKAMRWAEKRGYVVTVLDRKCRFPLWEPRGNFGANRKPAYPLERAQIEYPDAQLVRAGTYKALNRKLQGSGADVLKKAMVDAHKAGLTRPSALGAFLLTVHDELDTSVPRTPAGLEASRELQNIMETCIPLRVPLQVKVERGLDWGSVSESFSLL